VVQLNRAAVDHRRLWDAMDCLGEGQLREIETRLSRMVTEFGLDPTGLALDMTKLRGANSLSTSGAEPAATRSRRWPRALLTLRDQVIAPILAGVRSLKMGRKPAHWTRVDRDYERLRIDMQTLFSDLAIETPLAA
jgi:hypothetical protein